MSTSNRLKSIRFRELVTLALRLEGLPARMKPDKMVRLSEAIAEDGPEVGDIQGLGSWLVNTRSEWTRDLSVALDEAQKDAKHDEKAHAAVLWHRPGRPAGQSFVLMDLDTFSHVLKAELEPQDAAA